MTTDSRKFWYLPKHPEQIDSPALLVFPDRVQENISHLIRIAGDVRRLRPHVKTHKMAELVNMHLSAGIEKFKCSTIAEAEMLASSGAKDILLAYQPVGPKLDRLLKLADEYPDVHFGALVDDESVLRRISDSATQAGVNLHIWLDINNGMGRTGILPEVGAESLYSLMCTLPGISPGGIHAYDGQFRQSQFSNRKSASDEAFASVFDLRDKLLKASLVVPNIIAGGSPTFPVHAQRKQVDLSPGTYVFWDAGYGEKCPDLPFLPAAIVMTRVISKPSGNRICLDLGHKGIGAENPIENRVRFLNTDVVAFLGQSEEHLVVEVSNASAHSVGDVWYGVPWHICPTVALYQEAQIIQDGEIADQWKVVARDRKISL